MEIIKTQLYKWKKFFLNAGMLQISIQVLSILFFIVSLLLLVVILMQKPRQEGLGLAFGGATEQVFGAETVNVFRKITIFLASLFFLFVFLLGALIAKRDTFRSSLLQEEEKSPVKVVPAKVIEKEENSKSPSLQEMWKQKKK